MSLYELDTPCALLDRDRLTANLRAMSHRAVRLGVDLRPHMKTAKSIEVARLATAPHSGAIAVSTLREAEYFIGGGFTDILYAVSIAPAKLERAARLQGLGARITLVLDCEETARAVVAAAGALDVEFDVLIEIDSGGQRAGMKPDAPGLAELGHRVAASRHTSLRGVMTHAGASYDCRGVDALEAMADQERAAAVEAARALESAGLPSPVVSVGATPTATFARNLGGVTELRAGAYMFQDLYQAGLGVCSLDDIALSVLATVISRREDAGQLITDAGALALSKDRSTAALPVDQGYGIVCDAESCAPIADLLVVGVNQEHGMVGHRDGMPVDFERYPIGTQLRILPNHACMTAAAYDRFSVLETGEGGAPRIGDSWPRCNRW